MIQIESLTFYYPDGTLALDQVSLHFPAGKKTAVLGPNGAGKSTLLYHLNGTLRGNGHIRIDGQAVVKSGLKAVRRQVGMVFQNPDDQLFCPTVFEDVAFGPRNMGLPEKEVTDRVLKSLRLVGLASVAGKSAFHLSFGQKKLVSIATVLSMDPRVLVLDEPTGNLDPKGRKNLIRLLQEMGGTQIIATHDFGLVEELCDTVILLNAGKKIAEGDPRILLRDQDLLRENDLA